MLRTKQVNTLPALLLHSSFMLAPPELLEQSIPVYWMIERYAPTLFLSIFVVMLLGTLIQTGAGLIQGIVALIGKGYSLLAVGFGLVYVLPLLLRGGYSIFGSARVRI